jgi:hypothetical protein
LLLNLKLVKQGYYQEQHMKPVPMTEVSMNWVALLFVVWEEKRPLGRPRHRLDDNTKMDLREIGCCGMDRIHLAQDRDLWRALVNMVMNLWVP